MSLAAVALEISNIEQNKTDYAALSLVNILAGKQEITIGKRAYVE